MASILTSVVIKSPSAFSVSASKTHFPNWILLSLPDWFIFGKNLFSAYLYCAWSPSIKSRERLSVAFNSEEKRSLSPFVVLCNYVLFLYFIRIYKIECCTLWLFIYNQNKAKPVFLVYCFPFTSSINHLLINFPPLSLLFFFILFLALDINF